MNPGGLSRAGLNKALQSEATSETDHETLWESLKPIDQAVLRRLAENGRGSTTTNLVNR